MPCDGLPPPLHKRALAYTLAAVAVGHLLGHTGWWRRAAVRLPGPALGVGYGVALTLALLLAPPSGKAFIYFAF